LATSHGQSASETVGEVFSITSHISPVTFLRMLASQETGQQSCLPQGISRKQDALTLIFWWYYPAIANSKRRYSRTNHRKWREETREHSLHSVPLPCLTSFKSWKYFPLACETFLGMLELRIMHAQMRVDRLKEKETRAAKESQNETRMDDLNLENERFEVLIPWISWVDCWLATKLSQNLLHPLSNENTW
jgi:hypothetical protein